MRYIDATFRYYVAKKIVIFVEAAGSRKESIKVRGYAHLECSTVKANVYCVKIFFVVDVDVSPLISSHKYIYANV